MKVEIVTGGRALPTYNHKGQLYAEAPLEGEYSLRLTAPRAGLSRLLSVISVDGLNIITGEEAGYSDPGYVLQPGQTILISGWRRSDDEVAAFEFTPKTGSYSNRMGKGTSNVGVIGVAVFAEDRPPLQKLEFSTSSVVTELGARSYGATIDDFGCEPEPDSDDVLPIPPSASAAGSAESNVRSCSTDGGSSSRWGTLRRRVTRSSTEVGTGYGNRRKMYTEETTFRRATEIPFEVVTVRYATREKLIEWGVIVPSKEPNPFPAVGASAPAPPGWRG